MARTLKEASPHLAVKSDFIELTYFSGAKNLKIIRSDVEKKIVFDVTISKFRGREYIKGIVRDLLYDGYTGKNAADGIFANAIARFYAPKQALETQYLTTAETQALIEEKRAQCPYGLCLIASDRSALRYYTNLEGFGCDLFEPASRNVSNLLIVSPSPDADLSGYRDFIFLDNLSDFNIASLGGRQVCVNHEIQGDRQFEKLDVSREKLLEIFGAVRREFGQLNGANAEELANACDGLGFGKQQFMFALSVFEELGLVAFDEGRLIVYRGVKAELNDSALYRKVCQYKGR